MSTSQHSSFIHQSYQSCDRLMQICMIVIIVWLISGTLWTPNRHAWEEHWVYRHHTGYYVSGASGHRRQVSSWCSGLRHLQRLHQSARVCQPNIPVFPWSCSGVIRKLKILVQNLAKVSQHKIKPQNFRKSKSHSTSTKLGALGSCFGRACASLQVNIQKLIPLTNDVTKFKQSLRI